MVILLIMRIVVPAQAGMSLKDIDDRLFGRSSPRAGGDEPVSFVALWQTEE